MKAKNLVTVVLLLFVAASVVVLVAKGMRPKPAGESTANAPSDGVIAYYFHGHVRCPTCESIEAFAHEAVSSSFAGETQAGRLRWQVLNYEKPENERFVTEYEIAAPTVVLVRMAGGEQADWKNLDRVWELVGEKAAFVKYVEQETGAMLEASGP